ncbi:MAG: hypothetical protein JWM56_1140 [Candidatus Peribacteria bacterium]|nr:hypothetical protein [Candidatus Peribacteria bacterium]
MLSKVPEVTLYFWIIKILCTTVGETAADFLNVNLSFGLTGTSIVTGILLAVALIVQFMQRRYVPWIYWLTVALVSVFGTLVTDNLTDAMGVPLEFSTVLFGILLAATFLVWYLSEETLSMHSIFTMRRESFYWLAILFTFALGTASGDLMAEGLGLGYLVTGIIVASLIAFFAAGWKLGVHSVLSFWLIYILTRPLGASIGDLLSQPGSHGGLGLGATMTSIIFCGGIFLIVTYLSITKRDAIASTAGHTDEAKEKGGVWQTAVVLSLLIIAGGIGYHIRQAALQTPAHATASNSGAVQQTSPLGDLSVFRTITQDTIGLLDAGKQSEATARIGDLEYEWDNAQSRLKSKDTAEWTKIDGKIDTVLRELRAVRPTKTSEKSALEALLSVLK